MQLGDIQQIAIIGAGQMGQGIAQVCAAHGYRVALCDSAQERAQAAKQRIEERLAQAVQRGKLSAEALAATCSRLQVQTLEQGLPSADVCIEAIPEDLAAKRRVFSQLDQLAPERAVLCSNTSSIPIRQLAQATTRPGQVMGMHFMNPVPSMRLLELIRSEHTTDATHNLISALGEKLGKTVVTSQDRPGFIVNRILIPQLNEACLALSEGVASVEDIDRAITLGLNHPMGPLLLADWIGLDTVHAIAEVLHEQMGNEKYRPCALLAHLVKLGHVGVKAGKGFYIYEAGKPVGTNALPL
jgi:3-hydroxybutyryl-CoA dehydrogenase